MNLEDAKALKKGDVVSWKSQAGGTVKAKKGTVVCHIPKNKNLLTVAREAGSPIGAKEGVKAEKVAIAHDRVLVRVETKGKRKTRVDYYAPPTHRLAAQGELLERA